MPPSAPSSGAAPFCTKCDITIGSTVLITCCATSGDTPAFSAADSNSPVPDSPVATQAVLLKVRDDRTQATGLLLQRLHQSTRHLRRIASATGHRRGGHTFQ
jgi:hypothetical protein